MKRFNLLFTSLLLATFSVFFISNTSYASSGKFIVSWTGIVFSWSERNNWDEDISSDDTPKNKEAQNDQKMEEEDTKNNLNISFIELWKTIGAKTIKNLNTRYIKEYPNISERKKALEATKAILVLRRNKKNEESNLSETWKIIITAFLDNMIELLDKKIEELEK